ncbi:unnamed protein product [Vitrella brassicaformis CCMP3155]|uniref:Uncharacterized protein n=1 Tax=Vitrella brassicaformis (strain CCMP3155) TaxID=1169540 RepID=A0A0G4FIM1_VITBC|nr:unnamed protein product [Vitrella brassicaformis CCMP3155]|eukprot:CEM12957.1 unnamed protein product [Vitrella brassicaformis CCMP3155]
MRLRAAVPLASAFAQSRPSNHPARERVVPMQAKKAVVVGVNYLDTALSLKGCVNDALWWKHTLEKRFGFSGPNVPLLVDDEGRHETLNIVKAPPDSGRMLTDKREGRVDVQVPIRDNITRSTQKQLRGTSIEMKVLQDQTGGGLEEEHVSYCDQLSAVVGRYLAQTGQTRSHRRAAPVGGGDRQGHPACYRAAGPLN